MSRQHVCRDQDRRLGPATNPQSMSVKVWDLFVRVFHWLLVILFAVAWYSGGIWDNPTLQPATSFWDSSLHASSGDL